MEVGTGYNRNNEGVEISTDVFEAQQQNRAYESPKKIKIIWSIEEKKSMGTSKQGLCCMNVWL